MLAVVTTISLHEASCLALHPLPCWHLVVMALFLSATLPGLLAIYLTGGDPTLGVAFALSTLRTRMPLAPFSLTSFCRCCHGCRRCRWLSCVILPQSLAHCPFDPLHCLSVFGACCWLAPFLRQSRATSPPWQCCQGDCSATASTAFSCGCVVFLCRYMSFINFSDRLLMQLCDSPPLSRSSGVCLSAVTPAARSERRH